MFYLLYDNKKNWFLIFFNLTPSNLYWTEFSKPCLVLALSTLLALQPVVAQDADQVTPLHKIKEDTTIILYNGIELPAPWPPKNIDPLSRAPMPVPYLLNPPAIIPIDVGRQLFVDDFLIEKTNLKRVYHQAEKIKENPVLFPVTKNELALNEGYSAVTYLGHGGVFFDPAAQLFKLFYTAGWRGDLAMATSKDLLHWQRPELGLTTGNIILPRGQLMAGGDNAIWLDLHTKDTAQRFKLMTERLVDGAWAQHFKNKTEVPTHTLHSSADGRIWSYGVPTAKAADYCSFFYNPFRAVWVFSIKQNNANGRVRFYSENKNFLDGADWKDEVFWVGADTLDAPDPNIGDPPQLYSLNAIAYESILLGEFYIHSGPANKIAEAGKFPKLTELKLGFSRDGFHWDRPDRRPFIAPTQKEGDWDRAYLHGTTGVCLVMGDKLWFPYCGYSGIAPDGSRGMYTGASIGMATLRRDGFASMETNSTGSLLTEPVSFTGKYLFVNVDCPDGELKVDILDEHDQVIAPFSAKYCLPIHADKTLQAVEWKKGSDLSALRKKPVKFRFSLTNGKLYSFWISPDESGASGGYVGAGGPGYDSVTDDKGIKAYE